MPVQRKSNDPGLSEKYFSRTKRIINNDGSFNITRMGTGFSIWDIYQYLVNLTWPRFISAVMGFYFLINCSYAFLYFITGIDGVHGARGVSTLDTLVNLFFFSVQTISTVGYGNKAPRGLPANIIVTFETLTGLLGFALVTGLLYGRFSRPTARILYSKKALVSPYQDKKSFQFRIANQRSNALLEVEAKVMVAFVENNNGTSKREYYNLTLERSYIYFFPLSWTIVHPIDEDSPFWNKTAEDLQKLETEILILIKGYDDIFSQYVHSRFSYRFDEIIWGARFKPAFFIDNNGDVIIDLRNLHNYETAAD
ncbi:MAG TPA: ion channel [Ignavibacteriales bacterium]|nr:ion channel [Ignavibacteriales bacterium]